MRLHAILVPATLLVVASCGDSGGSGGAPGDAGPVGGGLADAGPTGGNAADQGSGPDSGAGVRCVRDPALIDQPTECRSDDLCPCGTHCELGLCTATCRLDADCEGETYCDDFGRCRDRSSTARIAPVSVASQGRSALSASPAVIRVADKATPYAVTLRPSNGRPGPARVVARGDVDLICEAGAAPARECRFANVPSEGQALSLQFRTLPPNFQMAPGTRQSTFGLVDVYDEAGHVQSIFGLPVDSTPAPLEGTYLGFAWLESADYADDAEPLRSQTQVLVFDRAGQTTLALTDQLGGVFGAPLVLEATRTEAGELSATLPTGIVYGGETREGTAAEVVVSSAASDAGRLSDGHLELTFPVRVQGLDLAGEGLPHRLVISANRAGELPEAATPGAPTPNATPTQDPLRGRVAPALYTTLKLLADAGDPLANREDWAALDQSQGNTLAGCFADPAESADAVQASRTAAVSASADCQFVQASRADFSGRTPRYLGEASNTDCAPIEDPTGSGVICAVDAEIFGQTWSYDGCADLALLQGCTVIDSPARVLYRLSNNDDVQTDVIARRMCWFDVARFTPPTEGECLGTTACLDETQGVAQVAEFTEALSPLSGDPGCRGETTFGVLEVADEDPVTIMAQCLEDLSRDLAGASTLETAFGSAGCVDRGRWRLRLASAARTVIDARHDPATEGMVNRLVQQWLQVHALVARIGLNQLREQLVLGLAADPTGDAVAALEASMEVWSTVLQPDVAGVLLAISPAALQSPDPRVPLGYDVVDAVATARVGVAVDLLETAAQQAETLDVLLTRAWFEGNAARLDARRTTAGELMRVSALAASLAKRLHRRANEAGPSTWETAWARALPRFQQSMERLTRRVELTLSDANPLGIEDSDLPLYYRGAPVTPEERFSATSRYLAGDGTNTMAVAPAAIQRAREALDAARERWSERRSVRDLGDRRIQDIKYRYGELVTGYCGASIENDSNYAGPGQAPCINPGSQTLFDCAEIDTEFCFVEEACRARPQAFTEKLTSADLGHQLCVGAGLKTLYGASLTGLSRELDAVLRRVEPAMANARARSEAFPIRITGFDTSRPNVRVATVAFDGGSLDVPLDALGKLDVRIPEAALRSGSTAAPNGPYQQLVSTCEVARQKTLAARPTSNPAMCTRADDCLREFACRDAQCAPLVKTDPLDTVDCYYDGAISEQAIAVRGAAEDIGIAAAEYDEYSQRYDIAVRSCLLLKAGGEALEAEMASHDEVMSRLDAGRAELAAIEAVSAGVKDCANTVSGAGPGALSGAPVVACGAAACEAAAKIGGAVIEAEMAGAEREHDATMLRLENQTELSVCLNDAELELVGARAATLRVLRAQQDQAIAVINLRGQKSYTMGLFNEGHEAVATEEARLERSLPSQFALSEAAELFTTRMAYAQRVTYLAVRAAEYEFQASLQAKQQVLAATRPDELESTLQTVLTFVAANRVGGAAPGSLHAVLSLRQHLLQLGDRADDPPGQLALTEVERFRALLNSSANSTYDAEGRYLGQVIRFALSPLGRLGRGNSQGIPVLADNDCAERVWSVNAAVLGEGVFEGNASSFTRLDLLKSNTFYSQRCDGGADDAFQVASVRPAVNLFFDPADPNRVGVEASATLPYTRGRMQPYLNVDRGEFEKEDYSQGATTELAGRGLYGDYALFIPAGVLSVDGGEGLRLERIDDILLRLDYVSVARN